MIGKSNLDIVQEAMERMGRTPLPQHSFSESWNGVTRRTTRFPDGRFESYTVIDARRRADGVWEMRR